MLEIDWPAQKKEIIRFWERRRLWWNLMLVLPALAGISFGLRFQATYLSGSPPQYSLILLSLFPSVIAANICYSCAYIVEFWALGTNFNRFLNLNGRTLLFFLGSMLGILLAIMGGASIVTGF